jgi:glyoxylase-like metal-dependent hydrolase (beta-lactamase superfamily II)
VIRHPGAGVLLIDTGLHPDARADLRKDFGLAMGLLFSGIKPAAIPFDEQLRARGVEPEEVERVVMTHLHVDHTSGMRLLPNARFICTQSEWRAARGRLAAINGYAAHHLPPMSRMKLVDLEVEGEPYARFDHTLDMFGDGTVRLIFTPGHTPGHQSLLVELESGQGVFVVGDAAYTVRSIHEELLPLLTADDEASRRTLRQLNTFAREHPEVTLVPTHDPDAWRSLPESIRLLSS